jgi:aminoglycoside 3-N-acetyltransferase I
MNPHPENLQIIRLNINDAALAEKLILLFQEVFRTASAAPPHEPYLTKLLANPDFIACVALHENEVIGGVTAYELPMIHAERSELFIYDLAVQPSFQRKGIATRLLTTLKAYGRQKGIEQLFVAANEEDTHAINFYLASAGNPEKVLHFTFQG